ncbi:Uncharacterised protein [Mycobacteroides abscessus subsp. abscessus]|nr:Uncharacterised protein [Mycobacteroides abscessus subsp. abscessus]
MVFFYHLDDSRRSFMGILAASQFSFFCCLMSEDLKIIFDNMRHERHSELLLSALIASWSFLMALLCSLDTCIWEIPSLSPASFWLIFSR